MRTLCFLLIVLVTAGCKKKDEISETVNGTQYATLKVTVEHSQMVNATVVTTPVYGASVALYLNQEAANDGSGAQITKTTDSLGFVNFSSLTKAEYYMVVQHPSHSPVMDLVATPLNAVTYRYVQM